MKTLYLVRHGKCTATKKDFPDIKRDLIKKGEKETQQMAKKLKKAKIELDLIVTSPAKRAKSTTKIFAKQFKYPKKEIIKNEALYQNESVDGLVNVIKNLDDKYNSVMVVGQSPEINHIADFLIKDFEYRIPKSGVLQIEINRNSWANVAKSSGSLKLFSFPIPKSKKSNILKNIQSGVEQKIVDQFKVAVDASELNLDSKLEKEAKKAGKDLAKVLMKKAKIEDSILIEKALEDEKMQMKQEPQQEQTLKPEKAQQEKTTAKPEPQPAAPVKTQQTDMNKNSQRPKPSPQPRRRKKAAAPKPTPGKIHSVQKNGALKTETVPQ